ncbi:unnamed protein product, partial [Mesorhabditis spiculigera]
MHNGDNNLASTSGANCGMGKTPSASAYVYGTNGSPQSNGFFYNKELREVRERSKRFFPEKLKQFRDADSSYYHGLSSKLDLPMARIKKIMKIDYDLEGQDAPLFLSKATELFIQELTLKSWAFTEEQRRKTIQKLDIGAACARDEHFDFLIDFVPREEVRKAGFLASQMKSPTSMDGDAEMNGHSLSHGSRPGTNDLIVSEATPSSTAGDPSAHQHRHAEVFRGHPAISTTVKPDQ